MSTKFLWKFFFLLIALLPGVVHASQAELNHALFTVLEDTKLTSEQASIKIGTLITRGADVNTGNAEGVTPLMRAVGQENLKLVTALLNHKADPNVKDREGNTALMRSAWWYWEGDAFWGDATRTQNR